MPRPLLPLSLLLCLSAPLPAVTLSAVPTAENAHYRITVSALRGARVPGLVDRRPGKEIVYRDAKGFGGLFDDRMNFIDAPYRMAVDMGNFEAEAVPLEIYGLKETPPVTLSVAGSAAAACRVLVEDDFRLLPGDTLSVPQGQTRRFWLKIRSDRLAPGDYPLEVRLAAREKPLLTIPLALKVWNVRLPSSRFLNKYYAFLTHFGLPDSPENRRRIAAYLENLAELRSATCDWALSTAEMARHARVAATSEPLPKAAEAGRIRPDALPRLDLSFFDPWVAESARLGMTRFEINANSGNGPNEAEAIRLATGQAMDPQSEAGWKIVLWLYAELRRYALAKGMKSAWAKVDDEIPPEHIPAWNSGAARFRSIGYRAYTTDTGTIPRNADWLNAKNKTSDAWQVAIGATRDFLTITRRPVSYIERREKVAIPWASYASGDAVETWATLRPFFSGDKPTQSVDKIEIYANGRKMRFKGGSGWGNRERGAAMEYAGHLYISLPDGGDPNNASIEAAYRLRRTGPKGKPPVRLDPEDEVWYYGGGNYRASYADSRRYPWLACAFGMDGYGYWTYLWWNRQDILVWYDELSGKIINSSAWEGLRDGNEDAAYFLELVLRQKGKKNDALRRLLFLEPRSPLRLKEKRSEIFAWDDIEGDFETFNRAKRAILKELATDARRGKGEAGKATATPFAEKRLTFAPSPGRGCWDQAVGANARFAPTA
ncbi:MAG: hypothetical protein IT210_09650 [Armatimonadetes bacterium]|nr:hypothetical protein [Armatimonadota bacterium]